MIFPEQSRVATRCICRLCIVALVSLGARPASAQGAPKQEPSAVFTLNARTVVEDVVVTDKTGRAVKGLHKSDFRIFENGKPQAITFFEPNIDAADTPVAPSVPASNTFTNTPLADAHNVTNVLLLDALNSWPEDRMYAHVQMVKYLASLPPGLRIAIFTLDPERLNLLWPFDQDSSALRLAVARYTSAHSRAESTTAQQQALLAMLDQTALGAQDSRLAESALALQKFLKYGPGAIEQFNHGVGSPFHTLARYLAGIPGRKNLFWVVGNIPFCGHSGDCGEIMDALAAAGVSVYPIDAHGVDVDMGLGPDPVFHQAARRFISSETWAEETGGKAYHSNDISQEIADAVEHGSQFYALAYVPTDSSEDGRERQIEVKLSSGNYTISYRHHYTERAQKGMKEPSTATARNPLLPQMGHGLPNASGIPYRIRVERSALQPGANSPIAGQNAQLARPLTRYEVTFEVEAAVLVPRGDPASSARGSVEIALMIYGQDFKPLNWEIREVSLQPDAGNTEAIKATIDAPAGETYLRTGIYDSASGKVGTLEIPLGAIANPDSNPDS